MTIREYKAAAIKRLAAADNSFVRQTPRLDVELMMSHVLEQSRTWLFLHDDVLLEPEVQSRLDDDMDRRLSGVPVAYITGEKEFFGRSFHVTPDVLIPKPDTELLVEKAVERAASMACGAYSLSEDGFRFADICTGSGCIAVSVLAELSGTGIAVCSADAVDISAEALEIAGLNADRLLSSEERQKLNFYQGDLCRPLGAAGRKYSMILSNPPYVPASVTDELLSDGRSEPRLALDGDTDSGAPSDVRETGSCDGLAIIRRLVPQVWECLLPGGVFLMETGEYNAESAADYLSKQGFTDIVIHRDLSGQLRLVESYR